MIEQNEALMVRFGGALSGGAKNRRNWQPSGIPQLLWCTTVKMEVHNQY
jgi:hypothetical protein